MNVRLSAPAFAVAIGGAVGLLDAAILPISVRTRGTPLLPPFTSLAVLWTWVTVLAIVGVLFSAKRLHRIGVVMMLLAGPGLLCSAARRSRYKGAGRSSCRRSSSRCGFRWADSASADAPDRMVGHRFVRQPGAAGIRRLAGELAHVRARAARERQCGADLPR
jgi:hypothetical protein